MADAPCKALARELDLARGRLAARRADVAAVLSEAGGAADDEHDPDGSPVSAQLVLAEALVAQAEARVTELAEAAARAAAGRYGVCERCGGPIGPARLAALPAAVRCVECARAGSGSTWPRPVIGAIYGGAMAEEPVTDEELERAEARPSEHVHEGVSPNDGTLAAHLRDVHRLSLETSMSAATLNGIHDRVHEEAHAVDD